METKFGFEKLEVWQLSRKLVQFIYSITQHFPDAEKYGLIIQMRRAAISICSNIAEGNTRYTPKDQAHFSVMAYGSLIELLNHAILANDLKMLNTEELLNLRIAVKNLSVKLNNLKQTQLNRINNPPMNKS
ncbi:MAG: four helix bundle protein [Ferruginibacter sp.]